MSTTRDEPHARSLSATAEAASLDRSRDDERAVEPRTLGSIRLQPYLFFGPAFVLVLVVSFFPLFYSIVHSLYRSKYLQLGKFVGLQNYSDFIVSPAGLSHIAISLEFVSGTLIVAVPLGVGLALALNRPIRFRSFFRTVLVLPWLVSALVGGLLWTWLLSARFGPAAAALKDLGITIPDAVTDQIWAMPALVLASGWASYPLVMVFTLAALQTVPPELHEAALIDGASARQGFWYVTLPFIRNTVLVVMVLTTLHAFNHVTLILVMTGGGPDGATTTLAYRIFEEGFKFYRMGAASAGALTIFFLNVAFALAYMRLLRNEHAT